MRGKNEPDCAFDDAIKQKGFRRYSGVVSRLVFFASLITIAVFAVCIYLLFNQLFQMQEELSHLQGALEALEGASFSDSDLVALSQFKELTSYADTQVSKIIALAGLFLTIFSVFGGVVVFRAPREIDNRLKELEEAVESANESARESKKFAKHVEYLYRLMEKIAITVGSNVTNRDKINSIDELIRDYPDEVDAYYYKAAIYHEIGEYADAIKCANQALKLLGDDKEAATYYNLIAVAYSDSGDQDAVIRYIDKALEIIPDQLDYLSNRAAFYSEKGEFDKAFEDYKSVLGIDPDYLRVLLNRCQDYQTMSKNADSVLKEIEYLNLARRDAQHAFRIDPENTVASSLYKRMVMTDNRDGINAKIDELLEKIDKRIEELEEQERQEREKGDESEGKYN